MALLSTVAPLLRVTTAPDVIERARSTALLTTRGTSLTAPTPPTRSTFPTHLLSALLGAAPVRLARVRAGLLAPAVLLSRVCIPSETR